MHGTQAKLYPEVSQRLLGSQRIVDTDEHVIQFQWHRVSCRAKTAHAVASARLERAMAFDQLQYVTLNLLTPFTQLCKTSPSIEPAAGGIVSFDEDCHVAGAVFAAGRQPRFKELRSDSFVLMLRQHIDSGQLDGLRSAPHELRKGDHRARLLCH
jgi:hypothetical protein